MDMKIELLVLPVTDVDRARDFYASLGWNVDHDQVVSPELRFVQITPPGSACSIAFGTGLTDAEPGSVKGIQLVIGDADAALAHVRAAGVDARGVDEQAWGRFVFFEDPDGNAYSLQQLPNRQ
jgi:catechol 2,3-dioxygenase-like lactoylglutathione lyase family enzyme